MVKKPVNTKECYGCEFFKNSCCTKISEYGQPDPSTLRWFTPIPKNPAYFIPISRVCKFSNPFSNRYIGITDSDIELIKNGAVLDVSNGSSGIFIGYIKEKNDISN